MRGLPDVTVHDLAAVRGASGFDATAEQALLLEHERVVLQFPWYWYSVPGVLKEWMDQVLTHGFAYGSGGDKLHGKSLQVVTSTGGPGESYEPGGYNRFTMAELMRPLDATAHLCGMRLREPYVVHGIHRVDDDALREHASAYRALISFDQDRRHIA